MALFKIGLSFSRPIISVGIVMANLCARDGLRTLSRAVHRITIKCAYIVVSHSTAKLLFQYVKEHGKTFMSCP